MEEDGVQDKNQIAGKELDWRWGEAKEETFTFGNAKFEVMVEQP